MKFIEKNRFLLFLIFLFATIAYPIFAQDVRTQELLSTLLFTLILISGINVFHAEQRFLKLTSIFFIVAILFEWLQFFMDGPILDNIAPLTTSLALVFLLVLNLKYISKADEVNHDVIYGVISGYILIGFVGGLLALVISLTNPGAFNLDHIISPREATYFSFVTMTTLGYGDITPKINETRSLAILLSIVGPMYVAIIVALIVGKFAARKNS